MKSNTKKTHIVHVVYSFSTGGLENGIVNLINNLPVDLYQHTIVCVTNHDPNFYSRIKVEDVDIIDLNKPPGKSFKWLFHCWKVLRVLKPNICHTRNLSAIEAQLPAILAGIKIRVHGEHGWDIFDLGGTNKKYQSVRKFFRPMISKYIGLSLESIDYLVNKINVNPSKIEHICNGVDISKFQVQSSNVQLPKGFSTKDKLVFGTVGRLAEVKNQTFLVQGFLKLWATYPSLQGKLRLVIVGDGILLPRLKALVKSNNAEDSVWFTGQRNDICELMNEMDVFVLPSLAEGIPNTLLEAMSCGLPFIATNVGGNADLVLPSHKATHIVPVGNVDKLVSAMSLYIKEPQRLKLDSQLVREHCHHKFSIKTMVDKYHRFYQNLV